VALTVPPSANAGSTVNVPITFSNNGPSTAAGATFSAALVTGLSGVSCTGAACSYTGSTGAVAMTGLPGSLTSGQSAAVTLSYTAPATGSVTASSAIGTTTSEGGNALVDSAGGTTVITSIADVTTSISAPATGNAAGTVMVPISFTNNGPSTAAGIAYSVTLPAGLSSVSCSGSGISCSYSGTSVTVTGLPTSLSAAQTASFTLSYTAPASGSVTVTSAIATSTSQGNNAAADSASGTTTVTTIADVTAMVVAPTSVNAGNTVTVSITFRNLGPSTAAGVTYTATLAPGLSGVSCSGAATCTYTGSSGAVTFSGLPVSLANGQTAAIALSYTAPGSGSVTATATIGTSTGQGSNTAADSAGDTTIVAPIADVTTEVSAPASADSGSFVQIQVTFGNNGPSAAAGVTYGITLPAGLSGTSCSGATCTYNAVSGVVAISGLPGTLASGESRTLHLTLSYTAPPSGGSVTVGSTIGTVTSQGSNSAPDTASGTTTIIPIADVMATLSAPAGAVAGTMVSVPVTFSNNGPSSAAGVTCGVTLATGLSTVSCSGSGASCSYNSATGVVTVTGLPGTLASGDTKALSLSYRAPVSGSVTATATIGTTTSQGSNSGADSASDVTTITPTADVTATVTAPASANGGSTVSVPVSFANVGGSVAEGVTYLITLPAGLAGVTCGGAGCSYDGTTGMVTVTGLPTALGSGERHDLILHYTAPLSGTVAVVATIPRPPPWRPTAPIIPIPAPRR
jgi:uncharacterized repeat protein (TIGR01451 family)